MARAKRNKPTTAKPAQHQSVSGRATTVLEHDDAVEETDQEQLVERQPASPRQQHSQQHSQQLQQRQATLQTVSPLAAATEQSSNTECKYQASLRSLSIQGFKSFNGGGEIGPLGRFTCVVGPNGCGKSVVGEAIAFALGGSKKMLRANGQAALINQQLKEAGPAQAQVTVCLSAVDVAEPSSQHVLCVRKTIHSSQSSRISLRTAGVDNSWTTVSQAQLSDRLAQYGLQSDAIDRFVVTQHRHAVSVQDPLELVQYLETLLGTAHIQELITRKHAEVCKLHQDIDDMADNIDRLETERELLAPQVQLWNRYQQEAKQLNKRKSQLLADTATVLSADVAAQQKQLVDHKAELRQARGVETEAAAAVAVAERDVAKHKEELNDVKKGQAAAKKQVEKLSLQLASLRAEQVDMVKRHTAEHKLLNVLLKDCAKLEQDAGQWQQAASETAEQLQTATASMQQCQATLSSLQGSSGGSLSSAAAGLRDAVSAGQTRLGLLQQASDRASTDLHDAQDAEKAYLQQLAAQERALLSAQQDLQKLQSSKPAAAQSLAAAQHKLQAARDQQLRHEQRTADLQMDIASLQDEGVGTDSGANARNRAAGGRWGAYDAALTTLRQQLPGRFFGRLCNVAAVIEPSATVAVNAMLREVANLATCVVVTNRPTASHVIRHFTQHRIGTVTCKIIAEARHPSGPNASVVAAQAEATAGGGSATPLSELVRLDEGAASAAAVVAAMLDSWCLVDSRGTALRLRRCRSCARASFVTRQGEVFKADGEIVAGGGADVRQQHTDDYSLGPAVRAWNDTSATARREPQRTNDAAQQSSKRLQELYAEVRQQQEAMTQHETVAAAQAREVSRLTAELEALDITHAKAARKLTKDIKSASAASAQLRTKLDQARRKAEEAAAAIKQFTARVQEEQAGIDASRAQLEAIVRQQDQGEALLRAEAELQELTSQQASLRSTLQAQQQKARHVGSQLRAAQAEIKRLQQQDREAETAAVAHKLGALQSQVATHQEEAARLTKQSKQLAKQHKGASEEQEKLHRQHSAASNSVKAAAAEVHSAKQQLQELNAKLQHVLAAAGEPAQPAAAGGTAAADDAQHRSGGDQHVSADSAADDSYNGSGDGGADDMAVDDETAAVAADDDTAAVAEKGGAAAQVHDGAGVTYSDDDFEQPIRIARRRAANRHNGANGRATAAADDATPLHSDVRRRRGRLGARATTDATTARPAAGESVPVDKALRGKDIAALRRRVASEAVELKDQEDRLHEMRQGIDSAALDRDLEALKGLERSRHELAQLELHVEDAASEEQRLQDDRYNQLTSALHVINHHLPKVYKFLTAEQGDALLSYAQDRRLLFAEGVTLNIRPDGHRWWQFSSLSGGQQALAMLALSFALQAASPSPFYFFDEIDAALDTASARRVAEYILQQSSAQYIVVSHKPQVYEAASCLVGLYSIEGGSAAVTAQL